MKIKNSIIITFVTTFVFVMVVVGVSIGLNTSNLIRSQINSYLYSSSRARAEHIRTFLHEQKNTTEVLASASLYRDFLKDTTNSAMAESVQFLLERTKGTDDNIHEAFIIDTKGVIRASSDNSQVGIDKSSDIYFTEGSKETYIKDVYLSKSINKLTYAISSPILDETNNTLLGVSVIRYSPDSFFGVVKSENGLGDTEENFLINKNKFFLTPSLFLGEQVILQKQVEDINSQACFSQREVDYVNTRGYSGLLTFLGESAFLEATDYRGVETISTHQYIPETGGCLITKVDRTELLKPIFSLAMTLGVVFGVSLLAFIVLCFAFANRIAKPINALTEWVRGGTRDTLKEQKVATSILEVSLLAKAFTDLFDKVDNAKHDIERKVSEQTKEIITKEKNLEKQREAILNVLDDVQQEKDKVSGLAEDLRKFQMAVAGASDHIVITDPDGIIIYANESVGRITGFDPKSIIGKKAGSKELWGGQMPLEVYKDFWRVIKKEKKSFEGVFHNRRKNGEEYEASANVAPILDKSDKVMFFIGIERDVTKEKQIDKAKTEFVSLASHQLRTPLSAINWYTEMLLAGDAGKINKEQKEYLEEIYRGNQRMVDLVNSLLNVSRIDLGTFEISPEPVSICEIVEDVAVEMKHSIDDKKQTFSNSCPITATKVSADPKLLRIVIQNLVSNAIKYTPEGGKISVTMTYNARKPKEAFKIAITDTGYGIPENQKDKIFTKLFRADNVRAMDTEGTGLGLYIIKSVLDSAGGDISFESTEGKGTTFTITLPQSGMRQKTGNKSLS